MPKKPINPLVIAAFRKGLARRAQELVSQLDASDESPSGAARNANPATLNPGRQTVDPPAAGNSAATGVGAAVPDPAAGVSAAGDSPSRPSDAHSHAAGSPVVPAADEIPSDPNAPYWVPDGVDLAQFPPAVRAKIVQFVVPLYRDLVLAPECPLEKANGISVVHLTWLEIFNQLELARGNPKPDPSKNIMAFLDHRSTHELIERQLRLIKGKVNISQFLLRLKKFNADLQALKDAPQEQPRTTPATQPRRQRKTGKHDFR